MRALTRYFVPAAILMIVGGVIWRMGRIEQRSTEADTQLLTLAFDRPADYNALEQDLRYLRAVPPIGAIERDLREQRAASLFWRGRYSELALKTDAAGGATDRDPGVLLIAANAAYRGVPTSPNDPEAVQRLEGVLTQYSDVLRRGPWQYDAAYNYEFLAKRRDALVRSRNQKPGQRGRQAGVPATPAHTLHGRPGEVPPGATDMKGFKVIVPQRSDERREQPEAGRGSQKARKG